MCRRRRKTLVPARICSDLSVDSARIYASGVRATTLHELEAAQPLARSTHSASLNHIHAANLWNKLGRQRDAVGPRHTEEMRRLLRRTVELVDSCNARALSNIAHGLA